MALSDDLAAHLGRVKTAPFLFVGSGLSRRYLNTETWEHLLKRFADKLPNGFGYYRSKADSDLPHMGTIVAADFHDLWWKDPAYENNRKLFEKDAVRLDSPLKIEISDYLRGVAIDTDGPYASELPALRSVVIDGIITTNWDLLLEAVFPDFTTFVGQDQLLFSNPQGIAEIYKIHGSCTDPNSLILTKEDYRVFGERNPYLASKLVTIFIEHPVIFLGYSLSDPNIISILTAITNCLRTELLEALRDRLIFVQRLRDGENESMTTSVLSLEGKVLPVTLVKVDDFSKVYDTLKTVRRRLSAKLLRTLKSQLYELIKDNDPNGRLHVIDLDDDAKAASVDVVFGIGIAAQVGALGYKPIKSEDLCRSVVFNTSTLNAEKLILHTLPGMLAKSPYIPVFKFLHKHNTWVNEPRIRKTCPPQSKRR